MALWGFCTNSSSTWDFSLGWVILFVFLLGRHWRFCFIFLSFEWLGEGRGTNRLCCLRRVTVVHPSSLVANEWSFSLDVSIGLSNILWIKTGSRDPNLMVIRLAPSGKVGDLRAFDVSRDWKVTTMWFDSSTHRLTKSFEPLPIPWSSLLRQNTFLLGDQQYGGIGNT